MDDGFERRMMDETDEKGRYKAVFSPSGMHD
jgi:hypothetical protein